MKHILSAIIALVFFSCSPDRNETVQTIEKLESEFISKNKKGLDLDKGRELFEEYTVFLEEFPEDSLSSEYLYKAGKLAVGINQHAKAIEYLARFSNQYSSDEKAPQALLLLANYYSQKVFDFEKAEETYNTFLTNYPNHPMVKDVEFMKKTLGKTPEEILQMVQQNIPQAKDSI